VLEACDGTKSITQIAKNLAMDEFQLRSVVLPPARQEATSRSIEAAVSTSGGAIAGREFNGILRRSFPPADRSGARTRHWSW